MTALPTSMTAIGIKAPGGPEVLVPEQRPVPAPGAGEILVKVAAAGVNRPDVMQRKGLYPPPPGAPDIPGLEIAGEVVALGPNVKRWKAGDRVMALVSGGGYAEYCLAHESHALPVERAHRWSRRPRSRKPSSPSGTTCSSAAGSKPARRFWCTAARRASAPPRSSSPRRSARASSPPPARRKNATPAASSAPTSPLTTRPRTSSPPVKAATGGKGVDVILDMVGGDYIERNYEAAAVEGRIVQIAFQGSAKARSTSCASCSSGCITPARPCARARSPTKAPSRRGRGNALPLIVAGKVKPVIYKTFPLAEAAAAHALMESSAHIGKIVLTL